MRGAGFLAIWSDVERKNLTDYRHWLTREHTTERVSWCGRRWMATCVRARDGLFVSGGREGTRAWSYGSMVCLFSWLVGWLVDWLAGWLAGWGAKRLVILGLEPRTTALLALRSTD